MGLGVAQAVECLPSTPKAQSLIPSMVSNLQGSPSSQGLSPP